MTKRDLPSTAVGRRRLLKLAAMLEADAKNKKGVSFDLGTWGWADKRKPVSCGTHACAMGLAVASGAFKRAGLRPMSRDRNLMPRVGRLSGFEAAAKLFEIESEEADWLFDEHYYRELSTVEGAQAERAVAKRIRQFVAGKATP